jgi:hypothetical protein
MTSEGMHLKAKHERDKSFEGVDLKGKHEKE